MGSRGSGRRTPLTCAEMEALCFFVQHQTATRVPLMVSAGSHAKMCARLTARGVLEDAETRVLTLHGLLTLQAAIQSRLSRMNRFCEGHQQRKLTDENVLDLIDGLLRAGRDDKF